MTPSNLAGTTVGMFDVIADDEGKYAVRLLTVRCKRCNTTTTRQYKSVKTYQGRTCIHCKRALCRQAIVRLIEEFGSLTRSQIQRSLPNGLHRSEPHVRRILNDLIEERVLGKLMVGCSWLYHPAGQRNNP